MRQLLSDFLSAIVFLVVYGLSDNIYLATAAAVGVAAAQVAIMKSRGRPVDAMQWLVLGLVLVLGAATLITSDSRFIMVKPSIIHCAVGAVMLRRGWMIRYLPPIARDNLPESVMVTAGYAWAALMFALGFVNLIIATGFSFRVWAWFITFGAIGAKVAAFLIQYAVFRTIIGRKLRAAAQQAAPQVHGPAGPAEPPSALRA
ncbi:MAG TPA: septation protein IspZ [Hyphomicrobiaceae bacterium]|nr:septation protein IspZ [Hyphomicrobiaceae bacterium]